MRTMMSVSIRGFMHGSLATVLGHGDMHFLGRCRECVENPLERIVHQNLLQHRLVLCWASVRTRVA